MADDAESLAPVLPARARRRLAWRGPPKSGATPTCFSSCSTPRTASVLFRKNLTNYQTQSATYRVYTDDSPAPLSPTPVLPGAGTQAPFIAAHDVTLVGNEAPNTFNNLGWMTDGTNVTDGNNVEAGIDRDGTDGVDAPFIGTARLQPRLQLSRSTRDRGPLTAPYQQRRSDRHVLLDESLSRPSLSAGVYGGGGQFPEQQLRRAAGGQTIGSGPKRRTPRGTNNANFATPRRRRPRPHADVPLPRPGAGPILGPGSRRPPPRADPRHLQPPAQQRHRPQRRPCPRGMGEGWSDFYARALLSTRRREPQRRSTRPAAGSPTSSRPGSPTTTTTGSGAFPTPHQPTSARTGDRTTRSPSPISTPRKSTPPTERIRAARHRPIRLDQCTTSARSGPARSSRCGRASSRAWAGPPATSGSCSL